MRTGKHAEVSNAITGRTHEDGAGTDVGRSRGVVQSVNDGEQVAERRGIGLLLHGRDGNRQWSPRQSRDQEDGKPKRISATRKTRELHFACLILSIADPRVTVDGTTHDRLLVADRLLATARPWKAKSGDKQGEYTQPR